MMGRVMGWLEPGTPRRSFLLCCPWSPSPTLRVFGLTGVSLKLRAKPVLPSLKAAVVPRCPQEKTQLPARPWALCSPSCLGGPGSGPPCTLLPLTLQAPLLAPPVPTSPAAVSGLVHGSVPVTPRAQDQAKSLVYTRPDWAPWFTGGLQGWPPASPPLAPVEKSGPEGFCQAPAEASPCPAARGQHPP